MSETILKVNDLFCGAGGMGLGFKNAGFRLAGAWDFDKYAVESYGNNVSPKVKQADITQMTADEIPYADVWTFGFPCQDLSIAGKQAGLIEGKRSGLFFEVMRLLKGTNPNGLWGKPKIIMAENVKGLKKYLPVLEEEYNAAGYKMYYTIFNSKYWGVPQNRERYFVVGVRMDISKTFEFPIQQADFIPRLSSILETDVEEKHFINKERTKSFLEEAVKKSPENLQEAWTDKTGCAFAATATYARGVDYTHIRSSQRTGVILKVKEATKKGYAEATAGDSINISHPNSKTRRGRVGKQVAQTLLTQQEQVVVNDDYRVRRLTPREYARLQGFPDTYKQVVSDSQFYKQMGNAVTVNVAQALAEKIKEFLLEV